MCSIRCGLLLQLQRGLSVCWVLARVLQNEVSFSMWTRGDPRNHVLTEGGSPLTAIGTLATCLRSIYNVIYE